MGWDVDVCTAAEMHLWEEVVKGACMRDRVAHAQGNTIQISEDVTFSLKIDERDRSGGVGLGSISQQYLEQNNVHSQNIHFQTSSRVFKFECMASS